MSQDEPGADDEQPWLVPAAETQAAPAVETKAVSVVGAKPLTAQELNLEDVLQLDEHEVTVLLSMGC